MDYSEADRGKCITCGFAGKRTESGARNEFYQITRSERDNGLNLSSTLVRTHTSSAFQAVATQLDCIKEVVDLPAIARSHPDIKGIGIHRVFQLLFEEARHCPKWYPYETGHDPEWHLNDEHMQRIENDRRAFELKLFEMSQKVQEDSKAIAQSNDHFTRRVTKWIIILAVVQILVGLLTLTPDSWPLKMLRRNHTPVVEPAQHEAAEPHAPK